MKVVLLGGSGFIGSAVRDVLENDPAIHEIRALKNKRAVPPSDKVKVFTATLSEISEEMLTDVDVVVHLARMNARRFGRWGRSWAAVRGAQANKRLLSILWKVSPGARLIYVSGSLMYGNSDHATESSPLHPISFAREYIIAERPILQAQKAGKNVLILRFPWVLGKGSWFRSFYLNPSLSDGQVPCYGPGDNVMSFIDLRDAGKAVGGAVHSDQKGALNVAMESTAAQAEFVDELADILKKPVRNWSLKKLSDKHEKAVVEAFSSSICLRSEFDTPLEHTDWRQSLREYLS